jgi:phosphatidylglycerol:prolipoprotein diacylglycerol transferase
MIDWAAQAEAGWLYALATLGGLLVGAVLWARRFRERPSSFAVFVGALAGAYGGAKILYLLVEGWSLVGDPDWLAKAAAGKTILGALLGGYAGVEIAKRLVGHREATGDWFAVGVPLAIAAGRLGCLRYGCCLGCPLEEGGPLAAFATPGPDGLARWPAAAAELVFNLLFAAAVLPFARRRIGGGEIWRGQLFHAYLVAYGLFRFGHEFLRDTPKTLGSLGGYQVAAAAIVVLGAAGAWRRHRGR